MRFIKINNEEATYISSTFRIERYITWHRFGGQRYGFTCTCGWTAESPLYETKSNKVAAKHVQQVHENLTAAEAP